jgi:CheY-like chemotaxis protein
MPNTSSHERAVNNSSVPINLVQFLVVDDYALVRRIVGECLRGSGIRKFHSAEDGREAVDILRRRSPVIKDSALVDLVAARPDIAHDLSPDGWNVHSNYGNCVITDFNMPNGNGLELLQAIRCGKTNVPRDTPVILLTGYSEDFVIAAALELDVNAFIVKPVSRKTLQERIARVLASKIVLKDVAAYEAVDLPDENGEVLGKSEKKSIGALVNQKEAIDKAMRWLPVSAIQPGAVLAKDVVSERGALLLKEGSVLTQFVLQRLMDIHRAHGFDGSVPVKNVEAHAH